MNLLPISTKTSPRRTTPRALLLGLLVLSLAGGVQAASTSFKRTAIPFMEKHCYECHGGKKIKGDLDLKQFKDDSKILQNQKTWANVLKQIADGEMPPKKHTTRPTPDEIAKFDDAITAAIDRAEAVAKPDPGRVTVRRLNRTEYNNTVRDLLGVDFNPAEDFPADDIGHGFDNIGDVLSLSPVHLERYLAAAENIAARAEPLEPPKPSNRNSSSIFLKPSNYHSENSNRPVTNSPAVLTLVEKIPAEGDYVFRVGVRGTNAAAVGPVAVALMVDEREVKTLTLTNSPKRWTLPEVNLKLTAGEHRFAVRFANPPSASPRERMLFVQFFQVVGPADTRTEFQKRMAKVIEGKPENEQWRTAVDSFVSRAFRRPATKEEIARYTKVAEHARFVPGGKWEASMQELIKVVLCSPKFLFRIESDSQPKARDAHPVDEYQFATRLSYFLWSSMPDDELFALAGKKQLVASLDAQVKRMLKDPRAGALVQNFAMQWLQLRRLATFAPDRAMFPGFDERLRRAMMRETELFFAEIVREDRSVLDLVDANFTYLNEPLARHYGIADTAGNWTWTKGRDKHPGGEPIRGQEFVRVSLPMKERGGLLTHASVLTVTSNPTRTSPVKRGKWVLEQVLGTPPPPPPPGVSQLEDQKQLTGTLRQRMEQHRENPNCAACHQQMDSLGFAFENYDAIGRFRAKDGEGAIDPSGVLPDGKTFSGPAELKALLKQKKELVARNITEKLLIYALGRGLEYYDERAIKKVVAEMAKADYKFSSLVTGIVKSDPFRLRRGTSQDEPLAKGE